MTIPPLTVIEASAGTGKTFSLVSRLLTLIFGGVEPERIVALTFSRLAAGEIFNSFIERLSRAAVSDEVAREEGERLGRVLSRADFAAMLRKVVSRQHLSLIGTLDSFLMRVIRMMPLELGLEGEVVVMSDYRTPVERVRLVGDLLMLQGEDAKAMLKNAFRLAFGTVGARGFLDGFASFISLWHAEYRARSEASEWGDSSVIWNGEPPRGLDVKLGEIRRMAPLLERHRDRRGAEKFIDAVAGFGGTVPAMPKSLEGDPDAERAIGMMRSWRIARALEETRGVYWLMRAYEAAYASKVRAKGLVSFDDMPMLLKSLSESDRLALEYRMDSRFDHWALDEFQDTSRSQWKALENIVEASAQEGGTVFIVGDRKQSIYEWRGGDVRILGKEVKRACEAGNRLERLDLSRRYLGAISRAVNKVFGEGTVQGAFQMDDAPEGAKWYCRDHDSFDRSEDGFVEVVQAVKHGRTAKVSDFFEPVRNALAAVKPWERGISCAILVRRNSTGEAILSHLKAHGIPNVVFEGESSVADTPVLSAMTEMLILAEHPSDNVAYEHIRLSPLAAALWPDGMGGAAEVSSALLDDFTRNGLARTFRETREALKAVPETWNAFTESRFEDFMKCVAEFEAMRDSKTRLGDFAEYLSHKTRRDFAEPGMVRIMTMHQSKGLGFDHVIIPFYEPDSLVDAKHVGPLESESPGWILANPGPPVAMGDAVLGAAERRREHVQRYGALCLDYVAMTRARKALTVILHPANAKPPATPAKFSDLVRMVGLATDGDREWYLKMKIPPAGRELQAHRKAESLVRRPRREIVKLRPSESFYSGLRGDALFADTFGLAARRGTEMHERFSRIEWLSGSEAKTPLERELARPTPEATVWREKAYEIFRDGRWESGQFDRVVFWSDEGGRRAKICDYKTNALRSGESLAEFELRMKAAYSAQMLAYRAALSTLTGLAPDRIELKLLLVATQTATTL